MAKGWPLLMTCDPEVAKIAVQSIHIKGFTGKAIRQASVVGGGGGTGLGRGVLSRR